MVLSREIRDAIKTSYRGVCQYCEKDGATHVDHIVPKSKGGGDNLDNLILACERCNERKTNYTVPQPYIGLLLSIASNKEKVIRDTIRRFQNAKLTRKPHVISEKMAYKDPATIIGSSEWMKSLKIGDVIVDHTETDAQILWKELILRKRNRNTIGLRGMNREALELSATKGVYYCYKEESGDGNPTAQCRYIYGNGRLIPKYKCLYREGDATIKSGYAEVNPVALQWPERIKWL